jgi:fibronectin-binding autotransporter adhesin
VLPHSNSFSGTWTIDDGSTVRFADDAALGASGTTVTISGGAIQVTATDSSSRTFNIEGATSFINVDSGATFTLNGALSGSGVLSAHGLGTLVLTAASARSGTTSIQNGFVRVQSNTALGSGAITISNTGRLEISGVSVNQPLTLSTLGSIKAIGAATYAGTITVSGTEPVTLNSGSNAADTLTIGNAANDYTGGATSSTSVTGIGTAILPFANNYTGAWQVFSTLRVGNATALGTGTSAVAVNGVLEVAGTTIDRAITLNSGGALRGTGSAGSNGTITVPSSAAVTLASGASASDVLTIGNAANDLTGGGGGSTINVTGAGKVVLAQSSNYIGNWNVNSGTLEAAADARLGNTANNVTLAGGTFNASATFSTSRTFTAGTGGGTISVDGLSLLTINSALANTANTVRVAGDGRLALTAASARTGETVIDLGAVRLHNGSALGTAAINVVGTGILELFDVTGNQPLTLGESSQLFGSGTTAYHGTITVSPAAIARATAMGSWNGSSYNGLIGNIASGRNGGGWNGNGIVTSTTDASSPSFLTTIAIATAAQTGHTSFGGRTVSASNVLMMYTYTGDANLSGFIDADDYWQIDSNYGTRDGPDATRFGHGTGTCERRCRRERRALSAECRVDQHEIIAIDSAVVIEIAVEVGDLAIDRDVDAECMASSQDKTDSMLARLRRRRSDRRKSPRRGSRCRRSRKGGRPLRHHRDGRVRRGR